MDSVALTVSTVTPVYCGARYLPNLVNELEELRNKWAKDVAPLRLVESIFVIDGAIDNSLEILSSLRNGREWIKIISLSRNYGQHAATVAGICHSSGDWVITLDEDLQHRPSQIEAMFRMQSAGGADVVYARPQRHVHGKSWRDTSSRVVKRVLAKLTKTPQIELFNSFRLIRGGIARSAASSSSSQTYLDIALTWFTSSCGSVELDLQDARFIETKSSGYGLAKLIQHARRLIVSSQVDVASTGLTLGVGAMAIAVIFGVWVVLHHFLFPGTVNIRGWASTVFLLCFFSGIIISLLCIGLEYINIIAVNQLGKPTFFTIDRGRDVVLTKWFQKKGE